MGNISRNRRKQGLRHFAPQTPPRKLTWRTFAVIGVFAALIGVRAFFPFPEKDTNGAGQGKNTPAKTRPERVRQPKPSVETRLVESTRTGPVSLRVNSQVELARYYAEHDPAKGIQWLNENPEDDGNSTFAFNYAVQMTEGDPEEWRQFFPLITDSRAKGHFIRGVVLIAAATNVPAAWAIFQENRATLADPDAVQAQILSNIIATDPGPAFEIVKSTGSADALRNYFQTLGQGDGRTATALERIRTIGDPALLRESLVSFATSRHDDAAAIPPAIAATTLDPAAKDAAFIALAESEQPDEVRLLSANLIADPEVKDRLTRAIKQKIIASELGPAELEDYQKAQQEADQRPRE